jgi:site-specific DNA-methyltransferase (adenine-specific)
MLLPAFTSTSRHDTQALENRVLCCDALELLRVLPDASIDLIATDPPYFKVKDSAWDNQWDTAGEFIAWLKTILVEYKRVLKPNGSLYLFASPRMAARVEIAISEYFNVLNSLVWNKPYSRHNQAEIGGLRGYFPQTERIIFAEQFDTQGTGLNEILNDQMLFKELREYFWNERQKVKEISYNEINQKMGLASNGGGMASNILNSLKINWTFPTKETYELLSSVTSVCKRPYEDLRREYEALRRPFNASPYRPYTDVWTYRTVQAYEGKHECEKPLDMMKHIIETSTLPDGMVLDTFAGSGATLDAARQLGRKFIGCDMSPHWVAESCKRVNKLYTVNLFDNAAQELIFQDSPLPDGTKQLSLFAE